MIRPKVIFFFEVSSERLAVTNVGEGIALNINLDRIHDGSFALKPEPSEIPSLAKGAVEYLKLRPVEGSYKPDMRGILTDTTISIAMTSRYSDIEGRTFTTITFVGGGTRLPFVRDK